MQCFALHNCKMAFKWQIFHTIPPITIDQETYDRIFKPLERTYQGGSYIELPIPQDLFHTLIQFARVLKRE